MKKQCKSHEEGPHKSYQESQPRTQAKTLRYPRHLENHLNGETLMRLHSLIASNMACHTCLNRGDLEICG